MLELKYGSYTANIRFMAEAYYTLSDRALEKIIASNLLGDDYFENPIPDDEERINVEHITRTILLLKPSLKEFGDKKHDEWLSFPDTINLVCESFDYDSDSEQRITAIFEWLKDHGWKPHPKFKDIWYRKNKFMLP